MPGVCAWRGRAIPVLCLSSLLHLPVSSTDSLERTLVVESEGLLAALPVDEVRAVIQIPENDLRQAHVTALPYTLGEVDCGGTVMGVLDMVAVFQGLLAGADNA